MNAIDYKLIPQDVHTLLQTLCQNGYEAYIVGGCVRDCILGRTPQDWDITTSALPEQTKALFAHTFDTGIQHGTITVVLHQTNYEITTYRIDGAYEDNRHPTSVQFTPNLKEDLLRRDFTMNAIAYHPAIGFQDPFGGRADIAKKCIRGVGEPAKRFQEDALRMLRCVRFAAQLGFCVEPATYTALQQNAALIAHISAERIFTELTKLWLSPFSDRLPLLLESGLLPHIDTLFAERLANYGDALCTQLSAAPAVMALRWTLVLQGYTESEAKQFCKKLKFDNQTTKYILTLLRVLHQPTPQTKPQLRRLAGTIGADMTRDLLTLQHILYPQNGADKAQTLLCEILASGDCLTLKTLAIDGKTLMAEGIPAGKAIGEILSALLADVWEEPAHNQTEYLLSLAHQKYAQMAENI